jgi:hypothetical protein
MGHTIYHRFTKEDYKLFVQWNSNARRKISYRK